MPLPLAVLAAFLGMYYAGISSNIMSLAGIAIAIGVLVDAGIVVTENAFRHIEQRARRHARPPARLETVLEATRSRRPARVLLDGDHRAGVRAGVRADRPGREAVSSARLHQDLRGARRHVIAVTLVPVLCTLLLGGRFHAEEANPVMRVLRRLYRPVLEAALAHRACDHRAPRRCCSLARCSSRAASAASSCRR